MPLEREMVQKKGFQERHVWVAFQVHKRRGAVQRNNRPIYVERAKGAVYRLDKLGAGAVNSAVFVDVGVSGQILDALETPVRYDSRRSSLL
jgi:hypothetical protein